MSSMAIVTRVATVFLIIVASAALIGCSRLAWWPAPIEETPVPEVSAGGDAYPDVLAVELRPTGDGTFDVTVTISSPYDTPARYADGWRVLDETGSVLGTHTLLHDHAAEQPFSRTQPGLHIPDDIRRVTVQGRDQANGYGGQTFTVEVPES